MRIELEIKVSNQPIPESDIINLITLINDPETLTETGAVIRLPIKRIGELASIDPNTIKLILDIASLSAIGVVLKGIFDVILEWQKSRKEKIIVKVNDISLEIPASASKEEVLNLTNRLAEIACSIQSTHNAETEGR